MSDFWQTVRAFLVMIAMFAAFTSPYWLGQIIYSTCGYSCFQGSGPSDLDRP